ncbi:MAG: response regulator [Anaerolineales bacterium]|nr:response regulator [Anaerolineales bacterium]
MKKPRILLVDDDRQIARMFRSSLELSGRAYEVIDVPSGEEALLELGKAAVDLVVSDLRLPGISGLELLKIVRKQNPMARAIMITAHPSEIVRDKAQELGVVAFMTKPIHTNAFLEIVDRVVTLQEKEVREEIVRQEQRKKVIPFLQELQKTTGAVFVLLAGADAEPLASVGEVGNTNFDILKPLLVDAGRVSIRLSAALGASTPWNIHYFSGSDISLYLVSAGFDTSLLIGVPQEADYGQVGSVARHARKTFSQLLSVFSTQDTLAETVSDQDPDILPVELKEAPVDPEAVVDAARFWGVMENKPSSPTQTDSDTISYEEARQIGLIQDDLSDDETRT